MTDNIIPFPVPCRVPPFIGAWASFMIVIEAENEDALPIRGRAATEGPQIELCPKYIDLDDIEDSSVANFWLPPCVVQIALTVLTESLTASDNIGRFTSPRWTAFRTAVQEEMGMEWTEILKAARREGLDFMADNIAANLIIESGIAEAVAT